MHLRPRDRSRARFFGVGSRSAAIAAGAAALSFVATGCESSPRADAGSSAPEPTTWVRPSDRPSLDEIEARYVVGPTAARLLDYRVDWQYPSAGQDLRHLVIRDDSVFTLDGENILMRLRRDDGERMWRLPVASPVEEIIGITYIPEIERVILTTGGDLLVLDAATGSQLQKQPLEKIANTPPIVLGQFLIYGARNGQLIWHSHQIAYQWRGYQISQSINVKPVYIDGAVVVVGNDGMIMTLDAVSASQIWSKRLLDGIVAAPAAGMGAVYVASLDQHVWALDLASGRNFWRYLTESQLTEPPVLIDGHLYQQVPSEGLVCFEARPVNSPGGSVVWTATETTGTVVTSRGSNVLAWDREARNLAIVEREKGYVVETLNLGAAEHLVASGLVEGDLFAAGSDGRLTRLIPRN